MIAGGVILVLVLIVVIALNIRPSPKAQSAMLTVWGTEDPLLFQSITQAYGKYRAGIKINYQRVNSSDYAGTVLNALASGQGPDIFFIGNRDLAKFRNIMTPASSTQFSTAQLQSNFPSVVGQDFVYQKQVYALPLYMDTLALIYNKQIFNQAGIPLPPATWNELLTDVTKLRSLNPNGQILKAAAALGGSLNSVDAAPDILSLLMLQNGAQMTDYSNTTATFGIGSGNTNPGLAAFNFYLQFANAGSPYYTWNDDEPPALDSFAGGNVAMVFGYHSALAQIKNKSPFLNYAVAPVPQPAGAPYRIDYASYMGLGVSKQSKAPQWAWDFIIYMTTSPANETSYLAATNRPPALLSLVQNDLNDPEYGVFARQALTATSWYEADASKIDNVFSQAILSVLEGSATSDASFRQAQDAVSQIMRGQ